MAFLIPAIEKIAAAEKSLKLDRQKISVLVLTPSRGHAERIQQQARALAQYHRYWVESIFGGYNVSKELDRIRSTSVIDILIATPSRLLTHVRETDGFAKRLQQVLLVVVDEADELVNRDFLKGTRFSYSVADGELTRPFAQIWSRFWGSSRTGRFVRR